MLRNYYFGSIWGPGNYHINYELFFLHSKVISSLLTFVLKKQTTRQDKVITLLEILPRRGPRAFKKFAVILRQDYSWISEKLEQEYQVQDCKSYPSSSQLTSNLKPSLASSIQGKLKVKGILFAPVFHWQIKRKIFMYSHFNLLKTKNANNKETIITTIFLFCKILTPHFYNEKDKICNKNDCTYCFFIQSPKG